MFQMCGKRSKKRKEMHGGEEENERREHLTDIR
jgi:hypothetical protein